MAGEVALGALCAAVAGFWAWRIATSWGAGYAVPDALAGAVMSVLALLRRRHHAGFAAAGLAVAALAIALSRLAGLPAEPGPGLVLGLSVLVGSAVAVLPIRTAAAIATGGAAVAAASLLTDHVLGIPPVTVLNAGAWLAALAYGTGTRLLSARRRAAAARIRRDERRRLARDLHDVVGYHLTHIVLRSQAAQLLARRPAPEAGRPGAEALADIETAGAEALGALRRVVGLLRDEDGAEPVASVARGLAGVVEAGVRLRIPDGEEATWPPEVAATVHRVVQESLTNVARHAPHAGSVTVDVTRHDGTLTVEIADDGPPTPARRPGHGIIGMRERVEALDGGLDAGPRADGPGWSVRATLPVRDPR